MRKFSCLDFDCKVRHFFLNTRCTSMTCTIVKSVKKIKGFYTHLEVFCHTAVLPPNWNNSYKCGQKCGQNPSVPPYYQYFISLFSRCLYINVEMNRHGSSFGSNNCSKRVVISVSIHFLCCGFGRVLRSASTGDAPFLEVPASPVFSPASPVLGWQIPSFLHFFRFLLHRFCVFLHEFCIFSHLFVKFSACANANWQISGVLLL